MTPQARVQAAIELLDEIIVSARDGGAAADTLIARYFKTRRYAGSKDRRAVREHVYAAIRRSGDRPASGRAAMVGLALEDDGLAALFDGSAHGPAPIDAEEMGPPASVVPAWLADAIAALGEREGVALLERAPLDLRVNLIKNTRDAVLTALPEATATAHARDGIRLPEGFAVESHPLWHDGSIEIQDEGSQLIAEICGAAPGMTVVDLCAGAGGKTLALAAAMAGEGRLIACDTVKSRLDRLPSRAERAGASGIELRLLDGGRELEKLVDLTGQADIVMVDAPCSGTGTWRRNPEARWRLTPERLAALNALQARIIDLAVPLLRPGGALVYAVCSVLDSEGRDQVAAALRRHSSLTPERALPHVGRIWGDGTLLTPARDQTDGFFVARIRRP
ncbi:RsmB/NOP family class I SAM-dependent RNA methyltransferase [Sphingomonas cavernae]|uniref:RsmB/NOP family class I SAM-dependent RNA methyltransferase n=1 Tax=Sphingomonas cavernae TaxID=2320861 RepID=A0A418WN21_9SPHN|nr:RsmB/NOP family class I SAM-dependent RNA methyltransferase [Sphingomonas cavernae]RJF91399.1 RsmB/NOP family class I SAM-dependent RNA methyltransferase [Sphingomonas cavernae]